MTSIPVTVFLGPSGYGAPPPPSGWSMRPPISAGDLLEWSPAIGEILILDGYFGQRSAITVTEIREACRRGVRIYGGVSMGALRAVECSSVGVKPVGVIARAVAEGRICDDAELSVVIGPEGRPVSVPYVDLRFLCSSLYLSGVSRRPLDRFMREAARLHFSELTQARVVALAKEIGECSELVRWVGGDRTRWSYKAKDVGRCYEEMSASAPTTLGKRIPELADLLNPGWFLDWSES